MTETGQGPGSDLPLARSPSLSDHTAVKEHDGVVSISPVTPCRNDAFRSLENKQEDCDSEFEFDFAYSSPISADEIFQNGQIKPLYSNFTHADINCSSTEEIIPIRRPLKSLMVTERQTTLTESVSCSSSESGGLEGVAPEMYCVWTPNKNGMRNKVQSTGSSNRWKFLDLIYRSHREGGGDALDNPVKERKTVEKKANGESDRKKSYLIGWFANMNGLSRMVQPF